MHTSNDICKNQLNSVENTEGTKEENKVASCLSFLSACDVDELLLPMFSLAKQQGKYHLHDKSTPDMPQQLYNLMLTPLPS